MTDAPTTSLPAPPPEAADVFGPALPVLQAYAALLAGPGVERGLLGPREAPRLWERHLLNSAGLAELLVEGQTVADLGSGAGLPGIVLAAMRPDVTVVLVEPLLRRATFLEEVVAELALRTVVVRRARGEDLAGSLLVDTVVARAVAPLDRLAGWALPLLHPGGRLLALKGERADSELAGAGAALKAAGASASEIVTVGSGSTEARVVVVTRGEAAVGRGRTAAKPSVRPGGISSTSKRKNRR
ncbi:MAG: 16S rRNA (guanine(527)-N(7))-methyltransferase RsmG [Frankiales bacterium]|nr:16S rRNA (guanine(527)-N(7))-methyltransferase RsmG [Frankiales bacterium]